ncbi:hypothetical protein ABID19_006962 [Mesorhizobium robiniae]|uniref:Transposase IS116/IS110/IS902 C-terminal domain-containing protein n=1 Tax=Mesorhizobium robiniae TaxID=559315 RepID=A0ABV2H027_9HYPH
MGSSPEARGWATKPECSCAAASHSSLMNPIARGRAGQTGLRARPSHVKPSQDGLHLNDYSLVVQAAIGGQGIAMGWKHIVDHACAQKLLVAASYPDEVPMRTWRDQMCVEYRLDQVLQPRTLANQLRPPGDLSSEREQADRSADRRDRRDLRAKRDKPASGYDPRRGHAIGDDHCDDDAGCRQFRLARDYAAWLGLTPKPHSTGGKQRVGRISKMGNRYIRRLLYLGAMAADHGQT